jgi:DNA-binding MarR family transcriptional regulator
MVQTAVMANEKFQPTETQEGILKVLKEEYQANGKRIADVNGYTRQRVNGAIQGLIDAGWVEKPNRALYRFVVDPREE